MELRNYKGYISADLLQIMLRSGVEWWLIHRKGSTFNGVCNYAYGNTIVFPISDEGVWLLAMTCGTYASDQITRYMTGMFVCAKVEDLADLDEMVMAAVDRWLL